MNVSSDTRGDAGPAARQQTTRRGFLRVMGRALGLAAIGAFLLRTGLRPAAGGGEDRFSRLCRRCPVLPGCSAPRALAVRDTAALGGRTGGSVPPGARPLCYAGSPGAPRRRQG